MNHLPCTVTVGLFPAAGVFRSRQAASRAPAAASAAGSTTCSAASVGGVTGRPAPKRPFAVAHTIIKIIWKVLSTGTGYEDLGVDYYTRPVDPHTEARKLATRIEQLTGRKVILTAPEPPPPDPDPPPTPAT